MKIDAAKLELLGQLVNVVVAAFPKGKVSRKIAAAFGSLERWREIEPDYKTARGKIDAAADAIRAGGSANLMLDDAELLALDDVLDAAGRLGKKARSVLRK